MKNKPLMATALAALLALGVGGLTPSTGEAKPGEQAAGAGWDGGKKGQKMMNWFDANKDGTITREEFISAHETRFTAANPDGSGEITLDRWLETRQGQGYRSDRAEARFKRLDINNDGVLTREEMMQTAERRFAQMDQNRDGIITADEVRQKRGPGSRGSGQGMGPGGQGMGPGGQGTGPGIGQGMGPSGGQGMGPGGGQGMGPGGGQGMGPGGQGMGPGGQGMGPGGQGMGPGGGQGMGPGGQNR